MAGGYGTEHNGVRIGVFWDGIEVSTDGSQARITDPRVVIDRDVNIIDSTNNLSVSGGAVTDDSWSNTDVSGSGSERIRSCVGAWRTLAYGATSTATFSASMSGVDYAGTTLTVSKTITYPARKYALPAVPTGCTVVRVSDSKQTVTWANTSPTSTSAPYTGLYVWRWDNNSNVWARIAALSVVSSFVDTTTIANRRYRYAVQASNPSGVSALAYSGYIATTPSNPTSATASKSGTAITVTWTNKHSYATGVQVWHAADGVWDGSPLASVSSTTATYTHTGASAGQTHQYRVRAVTDGPLYSGYATSGVVTLLAAPLAPTVTLSSSVTDLATNGLAVFFQHNPVDGTVQTAAQVRYRAVGSSTWTTQTLTTETSYTIPAGTLDNGDTYEVQAATQGGYAGYGPFSASVTVVGSTAPLATVTGPAEDAVVTSSRITATWAYYDAQGTEQSAWLVSLSKDGQLAEEHSGSGTASSLVLDTLLEDSSTYSVSVQVQDGSGLWSEISTNTFTTDFLDPPTPEVVAVFSMETGSVEVQVTIPATDASEIDPVSLSVYRESETGWALLADGVSVDSVENVSVVDHIPPLGLDALVYKAVLFSATPTSAVGFGSTHTTGSASWVFVNGGPGFATVARLKGNPAVVMSVGRPKVLHTFAGRSKPLEFIGKARRRVFKLDGDVAAFSEREEDLGGWAPFEDIADLPAPLCYRDPIGRRVFCSIGEDVTVKHEASTSLAAVSCTLTEVDYVE